MLLSAEFGPGIDPERDIVANDPLDAGTGQIPGESLAFLQDDTAVTTTPSPFGLEALGAALGNSEDPAQGRREIVFVDANVDDHATLIAGLQQADPDVELRIVVLDSERDGIEQIDEVLKHASDIDAVHVLSHGSDRGIQLGSTWLTQENLGTYADQIADWQRALDQNADLLLYGCDLASSTAGRLLVDNLAGLTGADVAASIDLTGNATLGGDWDLEYATGRVDAAVVVFAPAQMQWDGTLAAITVTTTVDELDGAVTSIDDLELTPGGTGISLREAVIAANDTPGDDVIFLPGGTYVLDLSGGGPDEEHGDLDFDDVVSVVGSGAKSTIIDGNLTDRLLNFVSGAAGSSVSGVTLQNGNPGNADGGAILSQVALTVTDAEIVGNTGKNGGAITVNDTLTLDRVTIEGNTGGVAGGVLLNSGSDHSLTNVTISGNNATNGSGGGLYTKGTTNLTNVTIAGNSAFVDGGGIYNDGTTIRVSNTIIADNTATGTGNDAFGTFVSNGSNLIEDTTGAFGFAGDTIGFDPNLDPLDDYGGETRTHKLGTGSLAIGGGTDIGAPSVDQRGFVRDDGLPDIGAFEAGTMTLPATAQLGLSTNQNVVTGGQSGTEDWDDADILAIKDPLLNLGPGTTSGDFSIAFAGNGFDVGWNINAAHYVTADIMIGATSFLLEAGDLLLSPSGAVNLASNNLVALEAGFLASVAADNEDLVVFRPDAFGDYSRGQFGLLLNDVTGGGHNLRGITLIEQATVVGGVTLNAGDFLYTRSGPAEDQSVWLYETNTIGAAANPDGRSEFLDGDAADVGIASRIMGLELIEEATTVGGTLLDAGTLLVNVDAGEDVGSNDVAVDEFDVVALEIFNASPIAGAKAIATVLFDGSDVAFDSIPEELDAVMLVQTRATISPMLVWADQAAGKIQSSDLDGSNVGDLLTGLTSPVSVAVDALAGKIYWSDDVLNSIQRANLNGTGVETIVSGLSGTVAIELNVDGGKIYWTEGGSGELKRADLDGTDIQNLSGAPVLPSGIALDVDNDKVYWADPGSDRIKQTSLTGAGTSNLVNSGVGTSADIAVDLDADQLYWSDSATGEIWRVDFDGSGKTTFLSGLGAPYGLAIDSAGGKIYWTDDTTDQLHSANLDGSDIQAIVSGIVTPRDVDVVRPDSGTANAAPTAVAGADQTIAEGDSLTVDGSGSTDDDGSIVLYEWDLKNDGSFEETGVVPTILWSTLFGAGVDDDGTYQVGLRITDDEGAQHTDTFTLTVTNTAPTLTATGDLSVEVGTPYTLNLTATDPGDDTIATYTINWGDGVIETIAAAPTVTHTYWNAGFTNNILISASDGDGSYMPGDLFLTSLNTDTMFRFDAPDGAFDLQFAGGDLNNPLDVEIGPDGLLYVSGFASHDVHRFNPATGFWVNEFVSSSSGGLTQPSRMAFGPQGNLYVTSYATDEVLRYDRNGDFLDTFVTAGLGTLDRPDGIAFGPDGNLYVASDGNGKVLRYDGTDGTFLGTFATLATTGFTDLTFGPDGDLYVSQVSANNVQRYDGTTGLDSGDFVAIGAGGIDGMAGLRFGPDGDLYVVGFNSNDIYRYDGSTGGGGGTFLNVYVPSGSGQVAPVNLVFDPAHQVFVNNLPNAIDDNYSVAEDLTLDSNDDWWDTDWSSRRTLSFNNAAQATDLDNFPVLVKLDATRIDYSIARADGRDLRFVDSDRTLLEHEIEAWNPAGVSYVWVSVPVVDGSSFTDFISMYYGNSGAAFVEDPAAVWNPDYEAVYHLHDDVNDTSANNNDGSNFGSTDATAKIGDGQDFDGSNDSVEISPNAGINDVFSGGGTISAWIKPQSWGESGVGRILDKASGTTANTGWSLSLGDANDSVIFEHGFDTSYGRWRGSLDAITLDEWQHVTVVFDSSSAANDPKIYVNGVALALTEEQTPVGTAATDAALDLAIGNRAPSSDRTFDGIIDEVRILSAAQTDEWVAAQYASGRGDFVSYGYEQSVAGVLGNDIDIGGDEMTRILDTGPSNAQSFTFNADGSFTYTPVANWSGVDTFTYRTNDGYVDSNLATVTITVDAINDQLAATNVTQTQMYTEGDASVALDDIVVTDVDTGETVTATLTLADTSAGVLTTSGSATYTVGTGVWTITDTVANVNTALAAVSFTPATNNDQDTTIAVNIADDGADGTVAVTGTITLDVTPVNDQLGATNVTQTQMYTEGDASVAIDDIVVTDVDTGETVAATLTLADTSAGVLTTSGTATYTVGTGVWTITGTVANVNTALAAVSFTPNTQYDQDTTIAVNIADDGANGTVAVTGTITLDVTPVNDQLGATNVTQTQTYAEGDASVAIDDIVVTDVDTGETVTGTLTLADTSAGVLTTSGTATYTVGTGVWTITGTVANVNTALAAVSFTPNTQYDQDTTIAVNIADDGANGTVAVTGTITLDVTPVNDQLGATNVTQTQTYAEGDASVAIDDIVVTDVDTGETVTGTLTLADTSAGVLTTSGTATYTVGTGIWTITDTVANVNTALAAVSFTPAMNNDQDTTIAVNIADDGADGTVAVTGTITLDVTPVNDQLGATNVTQTKTYTEGDASVALDDIVVTDVDTGETVTATLTLADTSAGVLTTSGTATYTVGTGIWTITDTVANVNTALAAVSFTPATNNDQDATIAVNIADDGADGTIAVTGTITLDVIPVNDQLGATNVTQTKTYTEGDASVALDDIVVTDVDTGETVTATLTLADTSAGVLTTSGTATYTVGTGIWTITDTVANVNTALAAVSFTPATKNDQDTTIAVNIADDGADGTVAVTGTITLDVTPVNDQLGATNVTQTKTYTEGDASVALDDIVVTDVDTGETVTATLTLADTSAGVLTTSGTATYTVGTGIWTITDTVANVNTALAAVSFAPATNNDVDTTIAVNIADDGADGTIAVTGTITLDVTPVNDQPGATNATQTKTYTEGDASVALDDIVVTDVDTGETVTATLTLADTSAGVLTTSGTATYTVGTGVWTITDTVANVNTALAAVSFTPATNNDQDTTIAVNIADDGADGTVAVTGTITLDVTPVNDQLGATNVTQTQTYTEGDASVAIDDIVVTDVDTGETVTATLTLADTSAGVLTTSGTATYTVGTGVWTITDTVANVNSALAAVSFTPATNNDQDTTIAVNIADDGADGTVAVTGTITLDVTPVNDQLGATNVAQTKTYTEGDASVAIDDIVVTDVDTGETVTAMLTLADTSAGVLTTSGMATYTAGTGVWAITDTVANVNTALAAVSFTPAINNDLDTTIAVNIADDGADGTVAVTGTISLDVTPVNDQLGATNVAQTKMYTEGDASVAIDDIVVTDVDTGETVTATLTLADTGAGVLTTSGTATYTAGTGVWTITDTVANVNTALAAVSFTPATNNDQDTTIAVNIADDGADGTVAVTGTISLDVTPVNDQLGATNVTQTQTYTEGDLSVAIDDIVVTDADTGETVTATLTLADTSAGVLTTSGTATYTVGTGVWTITDTVANVNTALAGVSFTPATNNDQDTTIAVNIVDDGADGTVAATGTITLDVTPVNDQLAATNVTQTKAYTEGDLTVAIDDIVVTDVDTGETVTATLTLADTSAGVLTASGSASYTAGTGVWTITDTVADVNTALAAVSFTPATNNDLDTTVAVSIVDAGENGTVAVTGTITLDVTPINDQIAATNVTQTQTYNEGDPGVALDDIVVTDVDTGETVTATLTLADPSTGALTTSGSATYAAGTGVWTITDTIVNVNTALAAVSFSPVVSNDQGTTIAVNIADAGENGTVAVTGTITLDVIPLNTQLTATNVTQTQSYAEGAASVALDDIVVTDPDIGEIVTAELMLADPGAGAITVSGTAGFNGGTGVWTITDSVANVNAALAAASFIPVANYDLDTTVAVSIVDGGESGTAPVTGTITLDVTGINEQPVATNLAQNKIYTEDGGALAFDDIVITDNDYLETITAVLTLSDPTAGTLTAGGVASFDGVTGVWRADGSVASVNSALALATFNPAANVNDDVSLVVQIADGGEDASVTVGGLIDIAGVPVGDTPVASDITTTMNVPSDRIVLDRNPDDGPEVTHFRISGITNGSVTLGNGTTPVSDGDYITVAQGQQGLRFLSATDSVLQGRFAVEASEDGLTVAAQSSKATATITVLPPTEAPAVFVAETNEAEVPEEVTESTDPEAADTGEPAAEQTDADAVSEQPVGPVTQSDPTAFLGSDRSLNDDGRIPDSIVDQIVDAGSSVIDFLDDKSGATQTGFVERFMFSVSAGLIRTDSYVDADIRLGESDNERGSIESLLADATFLNELDLVRDEINEVVALNQTFVGSSVALSTGISVGYVVWIARGGLLLASLVSSMPAWRLVDPLPILARLEDSDAARNDGDSLASILERGDRDTDTEANGANESARWSENNQ